MKFVPRTRRPTAAELKASIENVVPDLIAPNLKVLFCGINPGLYTAAIGHHFGRPGNRFWPALYAGGFSRRLLSPYDEAELLADGYGITNMVSRPTVRADELSDEELVTGGRAVLKKVKKYRPRILAVLGVVSYRIAFNDKSAKVGPRGKVVDDTLFWVLPNPSGLNAHFQAGALAQIFTELKRASDAL